MSKKLYTIFLLILFYSTAATAQLCNGFTATAVSEESRCAATGKIIITAANGSGTYNYSVNGPVSTPYTSSNIIDGLPAGTYQVFVKDVAWGCFFSIPNVVVDGSYHDPRFDLLKTDVTCFNGNNGSITVDNVQFGRPPFSYTIVAPSTYGVGTTNSTGVFTDLVAGNYYIQQRDSCGGIQTRNISILNYDWFIDQYTVNRINCDSADVFIRLRDIFGNLNTTPVGPSNIFNGYTYGVVTTTGDTINSDTLKFRIHLGTQRSLTIFAKDKCGNIKTVTWFENKKPVVANAVTQLNQSCNYFDVKVTGQQNLNNPQYCLYDSLDNQISCNNTGQFDSLAYGSYCIKITDNCYDTTITRCFTAVKPIPSVNATVTIIRGDDCNLVQVSIGGQTNLDNPQYCLYDSADVVIGCNNTGVFDSITPGHYCMRITGTICNDTTIMRCFTISPVQVGPGVGTSSSNLSCNTFTSTITGNGGLGNANYCLYTDQHVLITCNSTGVFDSLAYGSYCMEIEVSRATGACVDTLLTRCFTVNKPTASVGTVHTTKFCTSFNASINSVTNMSSPTYCLYQNNHLITCNNTGSFDSLAFGSYCIQVTDTTCADTTIEKCFTVSPDVINVTVKAKPSCSLDLTKITITVDQGNGPFRIEVINPSGNIDTTITTNNTSYTIDNLPNLQTGERYKIIVYDACGNMDIVNVTPVASYFTKTVDITRNCPGGTFAQGSSDVKLTLNSNINKVTPVIIQKNGSNITIPYTFTNGSQTEYTFKNLVPAVYIFKSSISSSCNITVYDTITITAYQYPSLQNSTLYRCDDNSFNITGVTSGGIGPVMYEIIGSIPSTPSIIAPPQSNPIFNINNGTAYTLVRLRALDVCGNASINDISTVPLVNVLITEEGGCMADSVKLKVDSINGATYSWYKKTSATDSVYLGNSTSYFIPVLTPADTGLYVCQVVLNSGCITRLANFRVDGFCFVILDNHNLRFEAAKNSAGVEINWNVKNEAGYQSYILERKRQNETGFTSINQQLVNRGAYSFLDTAPGKEITQYRLQIKKDNGTSSYSEVITLKTAVNEYSFYTYPNPVREQLTIRLTNSHQKPISWKISDLNGHVLLQKTITALPMQELKFTRPISMHPGIYFLSITDLENQTTETKKIIFQ